MAEAEESTIPEPIAEERHTQKQGRFKATVEVWEPIPDENLEDYESRFFSTFFFGHGRPSGKAGGCRFVQDIMGMSARTNINSRYILRGQL